MAGPANVERVGAEGGLLLDPSPANSHTSYLGRDEVLTSVHDPSKHEPCS
jgi:hypothetical protein